MYGMRMGKTMSFGEDGELHSTVEKGKKIVWKTCIPTGRSHRVDFVKEIEMCLKCIKMQIGTTV